MKLKGEKPISRIVNGRRYDISRAVLIISYENPDADGSFNEKTESLYRKQTGEYFLHGSDTDKIVPCTPEEAEKWVVSRFGEGKAAEIFVATSLQDDGPKKRVTYMLSGIACDRLARLADEDGTSKSVVLENLIHKEFDERAENNSRRNTDGDKKY